VIQACRVQNAVNNQMREVMIKRFALAFGFSPDDGHAENQVSLKIGWWRIRKGQDIGWIVFFTKFQI